MLNDAIREIESTLKMPRKRQRGADTTRRALRQLDAWIELVEGMLERDERVVPEAFVRLISGFVRPIDAKLYRSIRRNRERDAVKVLDTLFDAQQSLLPRLAHTA